jgi:hypothetical protein
MTNRTRRITIREARKTISRILTDAETVAIGDNYRTARGFIVGIPKHDPWNKVAKKKALSAAKAAFTEAWITESQR